MTRSWRDLTDDILRVRFSPSKNINLTLIKCISFISCLRSACLIVREGMTGPQWVADWSTLLPHCIQGIERKLPGLWANAFTCWGNSIFIAFRLCVMGMCISLVFFRREILCEKLASVRAKPPMLSKTHKLRIFAQWRLEFVKCSIFMWSLLLSLWC